MFIIRMVIALKHQNEITNHKIPFIREMIVSECRKHYRIPLLSLSYTRIFYVDIKIKSTNVQVVLVGMLLHRNLTFITLCSFPFLFFSLRQA